MRLPTRKKNNLKTDLNLTAKKIIFSNLTVALKKR